MRRRLTYLLVGISAVFAVAMATLALKWQFFLQEPMNIPQAGVTYEFKPGTSMRALATDLQTKGVVSSARFLRWLAIFRGQATKMQAGEYFLTAGMKPGDLVTKFTTGDVVQHPIRLGEGWTFKQIKEALLSNPLLTHSIDKLSDPEIMLRLKVNSNNPEGLFYPDTYHVAKGTKDITILKRAHKRMQSLLDNAWSNRSVGLPYKHPYEALILASIVEKETGVENERQQIAGVLVRRLHKGMRLQADPTVIYGLGDEFDGNLTKAHLQEYTPYNTYKIQGLPLTPIATPSERSVLAALNPDNSDTLYFVATGDGGHYFSATLKEHNAAVKRLLNKLKQ